MNRIKKETNKKSTQIRIQLIETECYDQIEDYFHHFSSAAFSFVVCKLLAIETRYKNVIVKMVWKNVEARVFKNDMCFVFK